jgi:hypothetical protein
MAIGSLGDDRSGGTFKLGKARAMDASAYKAIVPETISKS